LIRILFFSPTIWFKPVLVRQNLLASRKIFLTLMNSSH
jgi:hypothetical protein